MTINEFFAAHDLNTLEIRFSPTRGAFTAIRNSSVRMIKDSFFGIGDTPEAALADLMAQVNSTSARPKPAPVVPKEVSDLDDLLG